MNILTFDIEDWYIERTYHNDEKWKYDKFDSLLNRILDLLDEHSVKATFFCLGALTSDFPYVIKNISERGHEIGCHSNYHNWVNKMTPEEFRIDTKNAIENLEQLTGRKVISYRAPAFSIGETNKWALEILAECGIENDASIFPASRDFGGFPAFGGGDYPCRIEYKGISINEFPITMTKLPVVGKKIAYSGGGYFRLLPIWFVKKKMRASDYGMCYFHIADLLDVKTNFKSKEEYELYFKEEGTLKNRAVRYLKTNLGRSRAFKGLAVLMDSFEFHTVEYAASTLTLPKIML